MSRVSYILFLPSAVAEGIRFPLLRKIREEDSDKWGSQRALGSVVWTGAFAK